MQLRRTMQDSGHQLGVPSLLQGGLRPELSVGVRNFLVEGGSGTGKTSVCDELQQRGFHAIHGDRELAYQGDPETGQKLDAAEHPSDAEFLHRHHIWDVPKVQFLVADGSHPVTFFCGGSRNVQRFIHLFDRVFVLEVGLKTLHRRLNNRPDEWGSEPAERALILRLHATGEDIPPNATSIDANRSIARVVDAILARCG